MSGERAHYELEAGNLRTAGDLLQSMELSPNGSRLLPEQVWDAADIPERELFFGKPRAGRVRWCGSIRNTSSWSARCTTVRSSISTGKL
jgi:GH15 family glucan-1,4-alpha-glucosidase